jgi:hypothetical protein
MNIRSGFHAAGEMMLYKIEITNSSPSSSFYYHCCSTHFHYFILFFFRLPFRQLAAAGSDNVGVGCIITSWQVKEKNEHLCCLAKDNKE